MRRTDNLRQIPAHLFSRYVGGGQAASGTAFCHTAIRDEEQRVCAVQSGLCGLQGPSRAAAWGNKWYLARSASNWFSSDSATTRTLARANCSRLVFPEATTRAMAPSKPTSICRTSRTSPASRKVFSSRPIRLLSHIASGSTQASNSRVARTDGVGFAPCENR